MPIESIYDGALLWVAPSWLLRQGLSEAQIRSSLRFWTTAEHIEGMPLAIDYSSIVPESLGLPKLEEQLRRSEAADAKAAQSEFRTELITAYSIGYVTWMSHYVDEPLSVRKELAQAAAVLAVAANWQRGDYGFTRAEDMYNAYAAHVAALKLKYLKTSSPDRLRRWVYKAKASSIADTIRRPNKGNAHRQKLSDWHRYAITAYYAHPMAYTGPIISTFLNYLCDLHDQPKVSSSTVQHYIARREVQTIAAPTRQGKKAFRDFYLPYLARHAVMYAADLWVCDGTRANFAYRNERGEVAFLDVYMILDAHSWAVMGYAASENEDRWVIIEALKMAASLAGYLPAELLFDNFSAKTTQEMKELVEQLDTLGIRVRYAKVGNARDKVIERAFAAWQNMAARLYPNFVGEGVKSRRANARPAPEWIEAQRKHLPDRPGVMQQIADSINIYNEKPSEGGRKVQGSARQRLEFSDKPAAIPCTPTLLADLFWATKVLKMRNATIRFELRRVQYEFLCDDYEVWKAYDCNRSDREIEVKVRYDERDLSSVMLFDPRTNEFLCVAEAKPAVAGENINQTERDRRYIMGMESRVKSWEARLAAELMGMKDRAERHIAARSEAEFTLVTDPTKVHKRELSTAESEQMRRFFSDQEGISGLQPTPVAATWQPAAATPKKRRAQRGVYDAPEAEIKPIDW